MAHLDPVNKPLSAKMIRSVAFGGLRALIVAPIPFVLTPLILSKIGTRGYGTWAVFLAMNSLTSLADLGLLGTLSKYVAEYYAQRDLMRLSRLLNTGLVVFGILASVVVALLWIVSSTVVVLFFHGSALSQLDLLHLFHCALILVWVNIVTFLCSSVTSGLQRLDLTNIMATCNVAGAALGSAGFLLMGWGVRGLLYANIAAAVMTLLMYIALIHRLLPHYVVNPLGADIAEAKKIFGFSLQIYLTQAAVAIHNQIEKLFLALFVGVVSVGWYDIASDMALKLRSVPGLLLSPVLPAASELDARGEQDKIVELYYRAHKYLAFVGVPLVFFIFAICPQFVNLWIGPSLKVVAFPIGVLLFVNFFNLTTGPGYLIFAGRGFLRPGVYSAVVGLALNIPLSLVLIYLFGFRGAVVGTSLALLVASSLFLYLFHHYTRISVAKLFREAYLKPVGCSAVLLGLMLFFRPATEPSWFGLLFQGALFAFAYAVILICTKFFDRYDWSKIESVVPIARAARRVAPVA